MSQFLRDFRGAAPRDGAVAVPPTLLAGMWRWSLIVMGFAILAMPLRSFADSRVGTSGAQTSIDFRIIIPAIIRVSAVTQPDHLVIDDQHVARGYVDLDAGTSVKLTSNDRSGYLLAASYDVQLLSSVEVRISSQNLTASSGYGSMRVASGLTIDKLVPISYRLHLAPGVHAGAYRWPVTLAFSLVAA